MPVKRMLLSLAIGMVSLFIVLISGLSSDFVREETIMSRTFSAFWFTTLWSFVFIMLGEEYAIFRTKHEFADFIDSAQIEETGESFNREEYLGLGKEEESVEDEIITEENEVDATRPLDFNRV